MPLREFLHISSPGLHSLCIVRLDVLRCFTALRLVRTLVPWPAEDTAISTCPKMTGWWSLTGLATLEFWMATCDPDSRSQLYVKFFKDGLY